MTDMERKNLRRAMYSREAIRTEEDEEGERLRTRGAICRQCHSLIVMSVCVCALT